MDFDIMGELRVKAARAEAEDLINRHGPAAWSIAEDRVLSAGEVGEHERRVAYLVSKRLGFASVTAPSMGRGIHP